MTSVRLDLGYLFAHLFRFSILSSLDYFVFVLFAFVAMSLVSSVLRRQIG